MTIEDFFKENNKDDAPYIIISSEDISTDYYNDIIFIGAYMYYMYKNIIDPSIFINYSTNNIKGYISPKGMLMFP